MLTLAEKQAGYALMAYERKLIDRSLAEKLAKCKPAYDTVEMLVSLIECNQTDENTLVFLSRIANQ